MYSLWNKGWYNSLRCFGFTDFHPRQHLEARQPVGSELVSCDRVTLSKLVGGGRMLSGWAS